MVIFVVLWSDFPMALSIFLSEGSLRENSVQNRLYKHLNMASNIAEIHSLGQIRPHAITPRDHFILFIYTHSILS